MQARALIPGLILAFPALAVIGTACQSSSPKAPQVITGGDSAIDTGSEFREEQLAGDPAASASELESGPLATVYFDYDRFEIREDAKPPLRANARVLQQRNDWRKLTIEGHCDERGSEEYNLALGERRASVVKSYLVDLGISASRLETVSFGEAKPAVKGHGESTWRHNRRAEFRVERLASLGRP